MSNATRELFRAVAEGDLRTATRLIDSNGSSDKQISAGVNSKDVYGNPPIFYSVNNADLKMTQLLLDNGANVKDFPKSLHLAVQKNSIDILDLLLLHGSDINSAGENGTTPLHFTVLNYNESWLIIWDAHRPNLLRNIVDSPVKLKIAKLLISKGANVNAQTRNGLTTLHAAICKGFTSMVDLLLEYNVNLELKDNNGSTPLHYSALQMNADVCSKLLSRGADIDARNQDRRTPLFLAVLNGHEELVKVLLESGAQMELRDALGNTPLHLAADKGSQIIGALLSFGANADYRAGAGAGGTPLHRASYMNCLEAVALLLEYGADINLTWRHRGRDATTLDAAGLFHRMMLENSGENLDDYENSPIPDTVTFLIQHQIKMKTAGLYVAQPTMPVSRGEEYFSDFSLECQLEISRMKNEFIDGTDVSFYEILRKDTRSMAKCMENEGNVFAASKSDSYMSEFPIYARMIKSQFRKGLKGMNLRVPAIQVLRPLIDLPDLCLETILDFLTDKDLKVLIGV